MPGLSLSLFVCPLPEISLLEGCGTCPSDSCVHPVDEPPGWELLARSLFQAVFCVKVLFEPQHLPPVLVADLSREAQQHILGISSTPGTDLI